MKKTGKLYPLLFLTFLPAFLFSQTNEVELYKQKAAEVYSIGRDLSFEGNHVEALDSFKLFLNFRKKAYGENDYMLGAAYSAIGISYFNLGEIDKALEFYELAEQSYYLRDKPSLGSLAALYRNIGNVYRAKLDYNMALEYSMQALTYRLQENQDDKYYIYEAYYGIAEVYYLMNNYKKSLEILMTNYEETDDFNKIYFSELIAIIYQEIDEYDKADQYYTNTINLMIDYFGSEDMQLAIEYLNYAEFYAEIKDFDNGIAALRKAYEIISNNQSNKGIELSSYYEYMGDLYRNKQIESPNISIFRIRKKQNLNDAIKWYNKSLQALYTEDFELQLENLSIDNCLSFNEAIVLLKTMADTYNEMALLDKEEKTAFYTASLDKALRYYKVIGNLIQRARMEISSDESKIQLATLEYETFTKTIETAYLAYEVSHDDKYLSLAFLNSEQIKSSAVFDKISNDLAQENSLIPDSLLELESKLNNTISIYNEKIFQENSYDDADSALLQEYNDKIFEATRQRDELNRFLESEYPDYYDLKYSKSMLTIDDARNRMDKKDAILEFVFSENDSINELFTFLITKDKKYFLRQPINKEKEASLEYVYNFMSTKNYLLTQNEDSKAFCSAAYQSYLLLIAPFENDLINKNLTVVPDGKLNYIAFDGLIKTMPDTSGFIDFSKLDYLVRHLNVNYANSVNILLKYNSSNRNIKNKVLAFAPEYNNEKFELSNATYTLLPLPGVQDEVMAIAETVSTDIYQGAAATEECFRSASQNHEILHLAMHAYINDSLPAYSRLAFSPVSGEKDLQKDGWLNTADIYNLNLHNVRLTVLSACNTGVGRMQKGEGLMSLARGFLYAGCPSIIMSLWEVEDNAGTQIMTSFYKYLKSGKTKDEALRLAKIDYLDNANSRLAHPHYWMSFKTIGDPSPIYTSNDIYFFGLLILLIVAFAIDQVMRMKKALRKQRAS
ncbi:CHAT domain-containing protein [Maribellus mangrovi]|uniref:CHAT domain-containing protein n=1 Tax=Maribellus mangrovi TaxID=3133146 RepID=UPI0030EC19D0